ncbi:MAG: transketolase C-terminal domain-containing protein, partial [Candidatus Saelkia tenebricola]|nr:transketolase C-terminal domain-containing protein [Candidatus Saelkia tenebricola]
GAGFDYSTLGPTHHGTEDIALMGVLPGMKVYSLSDSLMANLFAEVTYQEKGPKYLRLDRTGVPLIYKNKDQIDVVQGFNVLKNSRNAYLIATGRSVITALEVAKELSRSSIDIGVIDLFRVKPLNEVKLWEETRDVENIITLEEHFLRGGIGDAIGKMLLRKKKHPRLRSIGIEDKFCREYGTREYLHKINLLDSNNVLKSVKQWLK